MKKLYIAYYQEPCAWENNAHVFVGNDKTDPDKQFKRWAKKHFDQDIKECNVYELDQAEDINLNKYQINIIK